MDQEVEARTNETVATSGTRERRILKKGAYCSARRTNGEPCMNYAMRGQTVCRVHGGMAPQNRRKAAERLAQQATEKLARTYGYPQNLTPWEALIQELQRTAGHVAWLHEQVSDLDDVIHHGPFGDSTDARVKLYQEERTHLAKVARDCLAAGVEERQVQLAEQQAKLTAQAMRELVRDLGHDPDAPEIRKAFRRSLEKMTSLDVKEILPAETKKKPKSQESPGGDR